jgi:hypothetical protein
MLPANERSFDHTPFSLAVFQKTKVEDNILLIHLQIAKDFKASTDIAIRFSGVVFGAIDK